MKKLITALLMFCIFMTLFSNTLLYASNDGMRGIIVAGEFDGADTDDTVAIFVLKKGVSMTELDNSFGDLSDKVVFVDEGKINSTGYYYFNFTISDDEIDNPCIIKCNGMEKISTVRALMNASNNKVDVCIFGKTDKSNEEIINVILLYNGYTYDDYLDGNNEGVADAFEVSVDKRGQFSEYLSLTEKFVAGGTIVIKQGTAFTTIPVNKYNIVKKIYVSPDSSNGDGTYANPFNKIQSAVSLAAEFTKKGYSADIRLLGGEYNISNRIQLVDVNNTADAQCRIRFVSDSSDKVVISGMKKISPSDFVKVTDNAALKQFPECARKGIYELNLTDAGFSDNRIGFNYDYNTRSFAPLVFYRNGKKQEMSKYPNSDYLSVTEIGKDADEHPYFVSNDEIPEINLSESVYIGGFLKNVFRYNVGKIQSIDENKIVLDGKDNLFESARWCVLNSKSAIDIPGEWCIDEAEKKLYYYAPKEITDDDIFEIPICNRLAFVVRANNIIFDNIEFKGSDKSVAVYSSNANGLEIKNCAIHAAEFSGISISGKNCLVDSCCVFDVGNTGIKLYGGGDKETVEPGNNAVTNNQIYGFSLNPTASNGFLGISFGRGDNLVTIGDICANNVIHGSKYAGAVIYGGMDNIITRNEMYNVLDDVGDSGVIYSGRRWNEYGNIISENFIHDYETNKDVYSNRAIFWDDYESGQTAIRNIILGNQHEKSVGIDTVGVDNLIQGNVIVGNDYGVTLTDRNMAFKENINAFPYLSFADISEAVLNKYPQISTLKQAIDASPNKLYKNAVVKENLFADNNVSVKVASVYENWDYDNFTLDNNDGSVFVDAANSDYRISSKAKEKYSFGESVPSEENFDMSWIGIQSDVADCDREFELLYPNNNSTVKENEILLAWENSAFADRYEYTVSKDVGFSEIVAHGFVKDNNIRIFIEDNCVYYWKIRAINESKSVGSKINCKNEFFSFTKVEQMPLSITDAFVRDGEKKLESISGIKNFQIVYSMKNNLNDVLSYSVIAAVFSEENELLYVKHMERKVQGNKLSEEQVIDVSTDFVPTGSEKIKLYIIDTFANLKPIADCVQLLLK